MTGRAAEDRLIAALRAAEQRLAAARSSSDIADREAWAAGAAMSFESPVTITDPAARSLAMRVLERVGLRPGRSSRQRGVTFVIDVPDVFLREVVEPELKRVELAYAEYAAAALRELTERAFPREPGQSR